MMVYSVAPMKCTVHLYWHFLLFSPDVLLQLTQLSCKVIGSWMCQIGASWWGGGTLYCTKLLQVLIYCCRVLRSVAGTTDSSVLADSREGSRDCAVLCMVLCCTVTPSCYCCRLLLCSCRRHLAARAPVHRQEPLSILSQYLSINYQGKKQT